MIQRFVSQDKFILLWPTTGYRHLRQITSTLVLRNVFIQVALSYLVFTRCFCATSETHVWGGIFLALQFPKWFQTSENIAAWKQTSQTWPASMDVSAVKSWIGRPSISKPANTVCFGFVQSEFRWCVDRAIDSDRAGGSSSYEVLALSHRCVVFEFLAIHFADIVHFRFNRHEQEWATKMQPHIQDLEGINTTCNSNDCLGTKQCDWPA